MKQLTLGELLSKIKSEKLQFDSYDGTKADRHVYIDFASLVPTTFDSWRGYYYEAALGYGLHGYDGKAKPPTVKDFIHMVEDTIGKTFEGWKGGSYTMTNDTPVWLDNPGNCNHTALVGIKSDTYSISLICEQQPDDEE